VTAGRRVAAGRAVELPPGVGGILMERYKLTADQAFQALARVSMLSNTKVRDIADKLVRTGEFPLG
jgi:AmiR/NasT family two-component response regulator